MRHYTGTSPTRSPSAPAAAAAPPPRSFTCGRCTDVFPSFETLQRHVDKFNHFRCTTRGCRRDFESRAALTAHRSGCRPTLSIKTEPSQSSFPSAPSQIWPLTSNASVLEDVALRRQRVLRAAQRPGAYSPGTKPRYVFMDTDNIIFSMLNNRHLHTLVPGAKFSNALRLQFDNFTQRVCNSRDGGRSPQVKMLRASYYGAADVLAQSLVRFGWGIAKREPAWDPNLEQQLVQQSSPASPSTLVLVTGDGNPSKSGYGDQSFRSVADKFLKLGWCVEIHAWAHSIHEGFLRLMEDNPTRVLVRLIDETEDLSGLVFAGKYNPCVAAVPSPRFRSQPPSPVHSPLDSTTSMGSVSSRFLFDDDDVLRIKPKNHPSVPKKHQPQHQQVLPSDVAHDRMTMLTCKLSGLVFTEPVLLSCCGETINNSAYAAMKSCPFCQSMSPSAMPNRAIQNILRVVAADPLH